MCRRIEVPVGIVVSSGRGIAHPTCTAGGGDAHDDVHYSGAPDQGDTNDDGEVIRVKVVAPSPGASQTTTPSGPSSPGPWRKLRAAYGQLKSNTPFIGAGGIVAGSFLVAV